MQEINKTSFVNQFYDLYKPQIKRLSHLRINQYLVELGKSENEFVSAEDILFICEKLKISCYGFSNDDQLLVKYISTVCHKYRALVWKISGTDFQTIEGNAKKSIVVKESMKHLKKPPKVKKMIYCDVCKMNHRQILAEGVYHKECVKKWFICGKNKSMSFSAEYSEESYQVAYNIWTNMEMASTDILDV
jgi:hypothetical protein